MMGEKVFKIWGSFEAHKMVLLGGGGGGFHTVQPALPSTLKRSVFNNTEWLDAHLLFLHCMGKKSLRVAN